MTLPCKHAMVLSGGAAYAAYEVGVMKALFSGASPATGYKALEPDIFSGTSAGAFNASALLSFPDLDMPTAVASLEKIWLEEVAQAPEGCGNGVFRFRPDLALLWNPACYIENPLRPFSELASDALFFSQDWLQRGINFLLSPGDLEQRAIELLDLGTALTVERFEELVAKVVRPAHLRNSTKTLRIAATNWRTGSARVFSNDELTDETGIRVVLASTSIPGIFRPIEIEGEPYVDGSVVVNTPLKQAIDAGAETLHVIYMNPDVQVIPLPGIRNTANAIYRIMVMGAASMMNRDIEIASRVNQNLRTAAHGVEKSRNHRQLTIHRYHPHIASEELLGWLSFGRDHLAGIIQQGFLDAVQHDCNTDQCVRID
jgi:predicted acylesterase/phospholipase RssA